MLLTISWVSTFPFDSPRKTSAPLIASSNVCTSVRSVAKYFFCSFRSVRCLEITPLLSNMTIFSSRAPSDTYSLVHDTAEAPAPFTTIFTSSIFFPATSRALIRPALEMIAVPCWSSCMTGMSSSSFRRCSILKHSGALISSRLIPPNVGAIAFTASINLSGSFSFTSMSNTSMPAYILNNNPFPSITGFPLMAPMSPNPRTAVPFEMTATKLPLAV